MPGHPRLYRRGAVYWHRAAVPVDIAKTYPKTEETFSLRTKDRSEALKLVRVEAARVDRLFDEHRKRVAVAAGPIVDELTDAQVRAVGEAYYAMLLLQDDDIRLGGFEGTSFEERAEDIEVFSAYKRHDFARGEISEIDAEETEDFLQSRWVGVKLAPDSPSWPRVAREMQAASIRAYSAKQARNLGEPVPTPEPPPPVSSRPAARGSSPLLSSLVEEWTAEKARTSWVPKTEHEHRVWMAHFIAISGDKPWLEYGKAEARAFKAVLMRLPANWNKFDALAPLGIAEASDRAHELGMPPMSEKNLNKLLGYVGSFWTWAKDHYDDCPANPFSGLKLKLKGKNVRDERHPFTLDELKAIFRAPVFTGCKSVTEWATPGALVPRSAGIFWVPLIGLLTGARLGEIIQMRTADVREEQGVTYLDLNDDGEDKRLKTAHSKRMVPLHAELVAAGFLELVEERRKAGQERLFPDLSMGADGYYSSPFSKHFSRFLTRVGVKTRKNAFHSFRHSFEDACRDSDIPKEVMDALQGHGEEGMSGRYGRGYVLKKLAEAMGRLQYDGLDLSHLRPRQPPPIAEG